MKKLDRVLIFILFTALLVLCRTKAVQGAAEDTDTAEQIQSGLLSELDFSQVQKMLDELLGTESFSFQEALKNLINGEEAISKETVQEFLRGLFFPALRENGSCLQRFLFW